MKFAPTESRTQDLKECRWVPLTKSARGPLAGWLLKLDLFSGTGFRRPDARLDDTWLRHVDGPVPLRIHTLTLTATDDHHPLTRESSELARQLRPC